MVPLSGVASWSQTSPHRWRFALREGVTFHNGEPWNAAAAKKGIDYLGEPATAGHGHPSFRLHGEISGEVADDLTVDVVCATACPIFPRTALFTSFQAPDWWDEASQEERASTTVGLGPYRIASSVAGSDVTLEAFEGYQPNDSFDAQSPSFPRARQIWRPEPLVRAALVEAGDAHWAEDIGLGNALAVPVAKVGPTNEVFALVADNIWHPELKKRGVRRALALAIDCELLTDILYDGRQSCVGSISQPGNCGYHQRQLRPLRLQPCPGPGVAGRAWV